MEKTSTDNRIFSKAISFNHDERKQKLEAICAEKSLNLYYPLALGVSQAITDFLRDQPRNFIYHGTLRSKWGRDFPDGEESFWEVIDSLLYVGLLIRRETDETPPSVIYLSVDDLEARERIKEANEGNKNRQAKYRQKLKMAKNQTGTETMTNSEEQTDTPDFATDERNSWADEERPKTGFEAQLESFSKKTFSHQHSNDWG